ncbi:MAG: tetratricopeptide repeat protein [Planctomycetota bacterium]|jgi:tetratricopeptide (TPR) repeat protein
MSTSPSTRPVLLTLPLPLLLLLLLPTAPVRGCLWDYDTLQMERSAFPSALELITGDFRRHSDEYYQWRVRNRTSRLPTDLAALTPEQYPLIDDLAVAHDKLGDPARGIALLDAVLSLAPDRYEALANRGTLKVHAGDLDGGLVDLRRALEVNPDAHFGREIVQVRLIEWLRSRREAGTEARPLTTPQRSHAAEGTGFESFRLGLEPPLSRSDAIEGLLGMVRFGIHDSPVLLEVLGELLHADGHKRTAARAYLRAMDGAQSVEEWRGYRSCAEAALSMQTPAPGQPKELELRELEATYREELKRADAAFAELRENEKRWIAAGEDVDARYAELYYPGSAAGGKTEGAPKNPAAGNPLARVSLLTLLGGLLLVFAILKKL